jgi:hypothetical protein
MKLTLTIIIAALVASCMPGRAPKQDLQQQIDSLNFQLANVYRPGLGEFMSGIQVHHAKLWFAGKEQNWKLAQFELDEIRETLGDIRKYNTDRPEIQSLPMIDRPLDSIAKAIEQNDPQRFISSYILLTNTCNNCHHSTKHEFNVIKVPDTPPFTNQIFKPQ